MKKWLLMCFFIGLPLNGFSCHETIVYKNVPRRLVIDFKNISNYFSHLCSDLLGPINLDFEFPCSSFVILNIDAEDFYSMLILDKITSKIILDIFCDNDDLLLFKFKFDDFVGVNGDIEDNDFFELN